MSDQPYGVLLVNLGSPENVSIPAVRRYLREFLMDRYVIDIPGPLRWLMVNGFIATFRTPKTRHAYERIWDADYGSPLVHHHLTLAERVQAALGPSHAVAAAMRYGQPSIAAGVEALVTRGVHEILLAPLYPHNALATVATTVEETERVLRGRAALTVLPPFYDDPGFTAAFAGQGRPLLDELRPDIVLFSYHGLPEHQVRKTDPTGSHCFSSATCCDQITPANAPCYRAQALATSRLIAAELALGDEVRELGEAGRDRGVPWMMTFQSRLGPIPWLRPHTDRLLGELPGRGYRRALVFCPAFVADNLETLEEVAIRGKETFLEAGGDDLWLVPSLNSGDSWVRALSQMIERSRSSGAVPV